MKILIVSPGKAHDDTVRDGIAEYQKRLSKRFDIEWNFPIADSKDSEGTKIIKQFKDSDFVVLLDELGKDIDTPGFAKLLDQQLQAGVKRLVVVIGGAFGVSEVVKERSNKTIKLSSLVFPHMLVRLILVEQLYRANSILEGGKYHHA
jgi:23S rRNA (pseudouridine1915-N3)-methyltransferase